MSRAIAKLIVDAIGDMISNANSALGQEHAAPQHDPDRSDTEMKFQQSRVATLRRIRVEFEDEAARHRESGI